VGADVSTTVTVNDSLALLPAPSLALQLIVVEPSAKVVPEAWLQLTVVGPSTRSVAEAEYVTIAPEDPVASTLDDDGTVIAGAVVSTTSTANEPLAALPWLSVAVQCTDVAPSAKVAPETGVHEGVMEPSTASVALAVYVAVAPAELVASSVTVPGNVSAGLVVSSTVTLKLDEEELPRVSVAEQVIVLEPSGSVDPDAGMQLTGRLSSTASVAVGAP
jgi:hypothetical protein